MARKRVVFVFDYPNIEASWWGVAHKRHLAGSWVDWEMLMQCLRRHAREKYGEYVEFDFRVFKNRNRVMSAIDKYDAVAKEKKLKVMGYFVEVNLRDRGNEDSDIDDDILRYVEKASADENTIAVYMVGSDLRNHNEVADFVLDHNTECWYVLMTEVFVHGRPKLPEGVRTLRLERLPGVFKYSGDNEYSDLVTR